MSRSASLLGNTIWIALSVATLLYPCLPARDPNGEVFALSRFDFALIYLASPEALWLQWTAGLPLNYWAVRGTTVAIALVWIVVLGLVGVLCLGGPERHEPQQNESRIAFWSLGLVLGYSILQAVFNAQEWLPTINKLPITVILLAIVPIASFVWRTRHRELDSQTIVDSKNASGSQPADQSLDKPWKRRLYGLATISCVLLAIIHIVGAMVPSVDVQVRNQKWVSTADAYEQQSASNMMLHSEGGDTKKATLAISGQLDAVAYLSMATLQVDVRKSSSGLIESSPSYGVSSVYPALLASKLVDVIIGIAGFLVIWGRARECSGRVPAIIMLMLILSTPATLELGRLGRVEWLATSQLAAIISVVSRRSEATRARSWFLVSILSIPVLGWFLSLSTQPVIPEVDRLGALLRFVGFSTLFAIPWIGCLVIGTLTRRTKSHFVLVGAGAGLFIILSFICRTPDRSWIPVLSFFALPVASGASWLLENQNRFIGFIVWFGIMVVSLVNAAYWPTMENRVLAPVEWLVLENWLEYGEAQEDVRSRYPIEFRKQLREGSLEVNSKVLLLGTIDDLDVPISCVTISPIPLLDKESIESWIQQSKVTHIGIVSNPEGNDSESRAFDEGNDQMVRSHLERLEKQGIIQKQPVSADCFDLTLFKVL